MANAPFPIQAELTAITVAYRNEEYIADRVAPRTPVGKQDYKITTYPTAESFILPDTKVGRKGRPNEVDLTASENTYSTVDYGLDDPIPQSDIDNATPGHNPADRATMQLTDYLMIDREQRVSTLVTTPGNYATGQKVQLSGTSQWSDATNSDPIGVILTGLDACLMRPNVLAISQAVWAKLRVHPKVIQAITGQAVTGGMATRQQVADLFELSEILVGAAWLNTAKKGQAAVMSRIWGKHAVLFYRNANASANGGLTFALSPQWGGRIAGQIPDPNIGLRGGVRVRVGESLNEQIIAGLAGYLIQDAVA